MPKRIHFNIQVYEKGGTYYHDTDKEAWFYTFNSTDESGHRKLKQIRAKTKNLLLTKVKKFFDAQEQLNAPQVTTIAALIDLWLKNTIIGNVAKNTKAYYENIASFVIDKFGTRDINTLTITEVETFLNNLRAHGGKRQQGLAVVSVNATRKLLHNIYSYAQQHKLTLIDPTIGIRPQKDTRKADQQDTLAILTEKEMVKFLNTAKKGDYIFSGIKDRRELVVNDAIRYNIKTAYLLVLLGFSTGMRIGELRGLRRESIDLENNKIKVTHQLLRYDVVGKMPSRAEVEALYEKARKSKRKSDLEAADNANPFQPLKTSNSKRIIDIDQTVKDAIVEYLAFQDAYAATHENYNNEWGLLFTTGVGTTINDQNFRRSYFDKILRETQIDKPLTPHKMRHTHASILLSNGIDIAVVSRRLGHANPSITYNIYVHVLPDASLEASNVWGKILKR